MSTSVLLVFATSHEAQIIQKISGMDLTEKGYRFGRIPVNVVVTGVGSIATAWAMKEWLSNNPYPDLAINAGIAGSYSDRFKIGDVVMVKTDCFADMGIESEGKFITLAEAGLMDPGMFPFKGGVICSENRFIDETAIIAGKARGITVNTCSGSAGTILKLRNKFNPDIETMESATFFYICAREKISFLGVRAISNKVEPGNRDSWNIPLALENLAEKMREILLMLE
jgi:futalosine hydrolase